MVLQTEARQKFYTMPQYTSGAAPGQVVPQKICGDYKQVAPERTSKWLPRDVGGRPFQRPICPRLPILLD